MLKILYFALLISVVAIAPKNIPLSHSDENQFIEQKDIRMIGRLKKGNSLILYQGKSVSDYTLAGGCNGYSNIFSSSEDVSKKLLNSIGDQIMISGTLKTIFYPAIIKENPEVDCLKNLSLGDFSTLEADKTEPIEFYKATVDTKVDWNGPLIIYLLINNPLNEDISFRILFYSRHDIFSRFEKTISLSARETKEEIISLEVKNSKFAQKEGTVVKINIQGFMKNCVILFDDEIGTYNTNGELIKK